MRCVLNGADLYGWLHDIVCVCMEHVLWIDCARMLGHGRLTQFQILLYNFQCNAKWNINTNCKIYSLMCVRSVSQWIGNQWRDCTIKLMLFNIWYILLCQFGTLSMIIIQSQQMGFVYEKNVACDRFPFMGDDPRHKRKV